MTVFLFSALIMIKAALIETKLNTKDVSVQQFLQNKELKCDIKINEYKLQQAIIKPSIIDKMNAPSEKKPWSFYKTLFISEKRISNGFKFMHEYSKELKHAYVKYKVPASIITAIIGVETSYGQNKGRDRLLDSLATLSFFYPKRAKFFQSELICYLNNDCTNNNIDLYGSYAGAFGIPQFMPCSYNRYAHHKKADILNSPKDAIFSVANYLDKKGKWQYNQPAISRSNTQDTIFLKSQNIIERPVVITDKIRLSTKVPKNAVKVWCPDSDCYWLYPNFNSIMTYNISVNYALAVSLLAERFTS